jgi:hypothetical protein
MYNLLPGTKIKQNALYTRTYRVDINAHWSGFQLCENITRVHGNSMLEGRNI